MKAITIPEFGPAENLQLEERPVPQPKDGEVLIRVHAAGINRPDILQRFGKYPPPEGITDIPGLEVAGEITDSRCPQWKKEDKVIALLAGGGYAEYVTVPAGQCLPLPKTFSMAEGAALPETLFTVWYNLFVLGGLEKGKSALVHGGSSGIGTMAIRMAKALGAKIFITAGSEEKCAACRKLGADMAINYKEQDFVTALPEKVDVVLDMVGGNYVAKNLQCLKTEGRHVSIAFMNGPIAAIDIPLIMRKRLHLTGSTLRARDPVFKAELAQQIRETLWPHIESGAIKPVIFQKFPLANAAQAHKTLEQGLNKGKIILEV